MHVIHARNVNDAYRQGLDLFDLGNFQVKPSRAGDTMEAPWPVTTVYVNPTERVLFAPVRDANPFFHLFESLWMLAGRKDVEFLAQFSKQAAGLIEGGASYGYRWRRHFGVDQLSTIAGMIKKDPTTRRAVLGIWDPSVDLNSSNKDIPCNDTVKFCARRGVLDMVVFNRSNDMIWGCYGANAVHFSFLQEYMAALIGLPVGTYTQISCNYHVYVDLWNKKRAEPQWTDQYAQKEVCVYPLVHDPVVFDMELDTLLNTRLFPARCHNPFLSEVAYPMWDAWETWKDGDKYGAVEKAEFIGASDWGQAATDWFRRRLNEKT